MRSRNFLKMIDKRVVNGRTAQRADNWHGSRRKLLGDNDAETGWICAMSRTARASHDATINNEARRFGNRFGQQATHSKITGIRGIGLVFQPAQGEHL